MSSIFSVIKDDISLHRINHLHIGLKAWGHLGKFNVQQFELWLYHVFDVKPQKNIKVSI